MRDFKKGIIIWLCGVISVITALEYVARAQLYADKIHTERIAECQANGYSWGECWNVLIGNKEAFDK